MTTAAVVLAAGAGTRFRGASPKLLAEIDGVALVERAVGVATEAGVGPVLVVTGAIPFEVPAGATAVANPGWADGIASSLRAGIVRAAADGHDAVVVGLADQPGVTAAAWRLVAAAAATPIAVATYDGVRGNPVRLAEAVWDRLPSRGDEGARALMRRCPELVAGVPCPGSPDDIDTVEDLRRWT